MKGIGRNEKIFEMRLTELTAKAADQVDIPLHFRRRGRRNSDRVWLALRLNPSRTKTLGYEMGELSVLTLACKPLHAIE